MEHGELETCWSCGGSGDTGRQGCATCGGTGLVSTRYDPRPVPNENTGDDDPEPVPPGEPESLIVGPDNVGRLLAVLTEAQRKVVLAVLEAQEAGVGERAQVTYEANIQHMQRTPTGSEPRARAEITSGAVRSAPRRAVPFFTVVGSI